MTRLGTKPNWHIRCCNPACQGSPSVRVYGVRAARAVEEWNYFVREHQATYGPTQELLS